MVPIGKPRLMKGQQVRTSYGTNFMSLLKTAQSNMPARDDIEQETVGGSDPQQPSAAPQPQQHAQQQHGQPQHGQNPQAQPGQDPQGGQEQDPRQEQAKQKMADDQAEGKLQDLYDYWKQRTSEYYGLPGKTVWEKDSFAITINTNLVGENNSTGEKWDLRGTMALFEKEVMKAGGRFETHFDGDINAPQNQSSLRPISKDRLKEVQKEQKPFVFRFHLKDFMPKQQEGADQKNQNTMVNKQPPGAKPMGKSGVPQEQNKQEASAFGTDPTLGAPAMGNDPYAMTQDQGMETDPYAMSQDPMGMSVAAKKSLSFDKKAQTLGEILSENKSAVAERVSKFARSNNATMMIKTSKDKEPQTIDEMMASRKDDLISILKFLQGK